MYFSPLMMRELLGALGERDREAVIGALLPGPLTLVIANPEHRYPLACREDPERLGVRLIDGPLRARGCVLFQTSANRSGRAGAGAASTTSTAAIVEAVDLAIDGGELTGLPSTVVDLTAIESGGGCEDPASGRARVDGRARRALSCERRPRPRYWHREAPDPVATLAIGAHRDRIRPRRLRAERGPRARPAGRGTRARRRRHGLHRVGRLPRFRRRRGAAGRARARPSGR